MKFTQIVYTPNQATDYTPALSFSTSFSFSLSLCLWHTERLLDVCLGLNLIPFHLRGRFRCSTSIGYWFYIVSSHKWIASVKLGYSDSRVILLSQYVYLNLNADALKLLTRTDELHNRNQILSTATHSSISYDVKNFELTGNVQLSFISLISPSQ